jgi:tetratricopeptide (TPR) repeat protein
VKVKSETKTAAKPGWKGWRYWPGLALAALVLAAYYPSLSGEFIWDDDSNVVKSAPLRTWEGLWRIWFEPAATQQYYPLTHTSFWLDYQIWGLHPFAYHLENVLLHALSAVLLWWGLKRLRVKGAWFGAALFALHPVQVETVAWITERKNTLSGVFFMASLLAAIRFWRLEANVEDDSKPRKGAGNLETANTGPWKFYWLAVGLYLLGLWGKTAIIGLPAVILALVWWKRGAIRWRDVGLMAPFAVVAGGLAAFTIWIETMRGAGGEAWSFTLLERALIASRGVCFYLGKLAWPHPLMFMYPRWNIQATQVLAYLPMAFLAVLAAVLWLKRGSWGRPALAALGIFVAMLFPVLGFFNVVFFYYSFVCDHFQYLAMIGPMALVGAGLAVLCERISRMRAAFRPVAGGVLVALGVLTWQQTAVYQTIETLWVDALSHNPDSWMAQDNLGTWFSNRGQFELAAIHYRDALRLHPKDFMAYNNLGLDAARQGNLEEAEVFCRKSLELRPDYPMANYNLGNVLARQGKPQEAVEYLSLALRGQRDFAAALFSRGNAYSRLGDTNSALRDFSETLRLQPEFAPAHIGVARLLNGLGRKEEAITHYTLALQADPTSVEAMANLGNALVSERRFEEAVSLYKSALRLEPGSSVIHYNLGVAYSGLGRQFESQQELNEARRLGAGAKPE